MLTTLRRNTSVGLACLIAIFAGHSIAQDKPTQPLQTDVQTESILLEPELMDEANASTDHEIFFSEERQSLMAKAVAGKFDYYLLAMSWSPNYCLTRPNETQCTSKRAFIIHGLWPQNFSGANPSNCPSQFTLTQQAIDIVFPYSPSKSLIQHEWKKHGVCSGKSSTTYSTDAVNAFKAVKVPAYLANPQSDSTISLSTLRRDFQQSSGLAADRFAVICNGKSLKEVRVCLSKTFGGQSCGSGVRDTCPASITINAPK